MVKIGNGWLRDDEPKMFEPAALLSLTSRWRGREHPVFGILAEYGPEVPPVFFLKFRYPVQTAASYGIADPQAFTAPVITWVSRN